MTGAAGHAVPDPSVEASSASHGVVSAIGLALDLGWQMAELYAAVRPAELAAPEREAHSDSPAAVSTAPARTTRPRSRRTTEPRPDLEPDLPSVGALDRSQRMALILSEVAVGLRALKGHIEAAGLAVPDASRLAPLATGDTSPESQYGMATAVASLHVDILTALMATDRPLGRAYSLGRALSDLCLRPRADDQSTFTDDFRPGGRVDVLSGQLGELRTRLPLHAAAGVQMSLRVWEAWAAHPHWHGEPLDWNAHGREVVATLNQQGRQWRALLTGRKSALDQLTVEDYLDAGGYLVGRIRHLAVRFMAQYWVALTIIATLVVGGVYAALHVFHSPGAKSTATIASVLAGLGVTWRTVNATLDRAVHQAEDSLWEAELDAAVGRAVTTLPDGNYARGLGEPHPPLVRRSSAVGDRPRGRRARMKRQPARQPPPFEPPLADIPDDGDG